MLSAATSARFQFADEIDGDGWTPGAKSRATSCGCIWTRGETFWNRKQVRGSTPLIEETSRIWKLWNSERPALLRTVPPMCEMQYLRMGRTGCALTASSGDLTEDGRIASVWYVGTCGCIIDESHKPWMDARGEWRPTAIPRQRDMPDSISGPA
jgi:phage terminase large subunit GpA-like protein